MKITKPGKMPGKNEHTGTCTNCRCQVKFLESEAEFRSFSNGETVWVVKCPTKGCGGEIWVNA